MVDHRQDDTMVSQPVGSPSQGTLVFVCIMPPLSEGIFNAEACLGQELERPLALRRSTAVDGGEFHQHRTFILAADDFDSRVIFCQKAPRAIGSYDGFYRSILTHFSHSGEG